jgi:D-serine deaminase-like pyridoxal phosphate-dependent protein
MPTEFPSTLIETATPALVLDRGKLQANCERLQRHCRALGVRLRPHMKTLKSIDVAHLALAGGEGGGIAVATLNEAEYFAHRGINDIQCAVCVPPDKFPRVAEILRRAPGFSFFLDSVSIARQAVAFAASTCAPLRVWLEIDCGEHRTGVELNDPALIEIARALSHPAVRFEGVATHAGHSYRVSGRERLGDVAEQERRAVLLAAQRVRAAGIPVAGISAGSTPTALHLTRAQGLTEIRAGVYMAGDLFQVAIGSLALEDVAVTVLATVVSHARGRNQLVIDAGGLALSKDRSTARGPGPDWGYGLVLDVLGRPFIPDLTVVDVHQEHGEIRSNSRLPFDRLPIGSRVRIVPNHVCMTAAMYGQYWVVDGAERIVGRWQRTNGWG